MPTVDSNYTYAVTRTNKSGKVINTGQTVTTPNLTAREIQADDGSIRLLVQWAEPDRAMELVSNGNVRLRIFIGPGWFNDVVNSDIPSISKFLWIDVPIHTGSVVVPAEQYDWVKQYLTDGKLPIAGMYREQFSGFHNRGHFEGIKFQIP